MVSIQVLKKHSLPSGFEPSESALSLRRSFLMVQSRCFRRAGSELNGDSDLAKDRHWRVVAIVADEGKHPLGGGTQL